ncbi:MAG: ATP-binding cassette domain-containing protein [Thiofilum sp.]|uniref:ABC transporter ATP-binding protein n=1 Tax=Thiofilum sp. TaxID=2212733 RepID=UPI0029EC0025|nr:ATP-binding cassette domain-containing protein [Thiofilum sp.]
MKTTILETNALTKSIPTSDKLLTILTGIDLSVPSGESIAITGTSGSGKSTLLGLLAALDTPTSGSIKLFGTEVGALTEDQRAQLRLGKVGFVFQSFHLLDNLTALENVMLPLELKTNDASVRERATKALQRVGLGERLNHFPTQLSGGEQQRVAIARAFVIEPQLLFADEPTGNLDRATGHEVEELLFSLVQDQGTALVMVTHDEELAARCQAHYHLSNGVLVKQGGAL